MIFKISLVGLLLILFVRIGAKKREMPVIIAHLRRLYSENLVFLARSDKSLVREWMAHNLLYSLHIARERTGSVDLNLGQPWYIRAAYAVIGTIAYILIK